MTHTASKLARERPNCSGSNIPAIPQFAKSAVARSWTYTTGKVAALAALLFLSFRYVGGFSPAQSSVLTLVSCAFCLLFTPLSELFAVETRFLPFYVIISPHWGRLFPDFGLDSYDKTGNDSGRNDSGYSVIRDGIIFTFLSADIDPFKPALIYRNHHRGFATEADFREMISEIKVHRDHPAPWHPEIYVKRVAAGYELGLWLPPGEGDPIFPEKKDTPIALLPYEEFSLRYWEQESYALSDRIFLTRWVDRKFRSRKEERWHVEELRASNGWKDVSVVSAGVPRREVRIEHKYFTVTHGSI